LLPFLKTHFGTFPEFARIYVQQIVQTNDVTPGNEDDVQRLRDMDGPFYVVIYPGWAALPWVIGALLVVGAVLLAPPTPEIPAVTSRNNNLSSPNNDLSDRSNRPRINGRIPDIFGTVRSTPDLLAQPYKIFENNREVEYSYMCIGRGEYLVEDIRDGDTLCINIPGTTVQVWGPYTSPNSGDAPQVVVGQDRRVPPLNVRRSNSVNGQVLRPSNSATFVAVGNVRFIYPNMIQMFPGSVNDFTKYFVEGDSLTVSGATMTAGVSVNESVTVRAVKVDTYIQVPSARSWLAHNYDTDGSLVFDVGDSADAQALFNPGTSVTLTQTAGPVGGPDLSGTYSIVSNILDDLTGEPPYIKANAPQKVIVKLSSPASVNAGWNSLTSNQNLNAQAQFTFTIGLAASTSYNLNLNGTYAVVSVTKETIVLDNPVAVNSDWNTVNSNGGVTPYLSPTMAATGEKWIGPFILTDVWTSQIYANFVASNGLYKDDGTTQTAEIVGITIEVREVNALDVPTGPMTIFNLQMQGSEILKETIAQTVKGQFGGFHGRCSVRARRTTPSDTAFVGTVVDEVRWRDLYGVTNVGDEDFGNVTTVSSIVYATASALAAKDRKLNMRVTRKLPLRTSGTDFDTVFTETRDAAEVFVSICRDYYIGRRSLAELDLDNIYDTVDEVETYFGHAFVREFSYTFDSDNLSFEEMANAVATAIGCSAYRRGNVIRLSFEKETANSKLLFNHRNKVPGSETRTISFGVNGDHDGVEYTYVDPKDDAIISVFLPLSYAALNPKKIESIGVRTHLQAYFLAHRAWNKLQYQNAAVEFEGLSEAELLVRNDRILVADSTRPNTQDGEVIGVASLELTLSKKVDLTGFASFVIFLQHYDGTVESKTITAGSASNKVLLSGAPALSLVTAADKAARTGFIILGVTETQQLPFLVSEKESLGRMTAQVRAVNYDARYYANDDDFIDGLIDENALGTNGGWTAGGGYGYPGNAAPMYVTFTAGSGAGMNGVVTHADANLYAAPAMFPVTGTYVGSILGQTRFAIVSGGGPPESKIGIQLPVGDPLITKTDIFATFQIAGLMGAPIASSTMSFGYWDHTQPGFPVGGDPAYRYYHWGFPYIGALTPGNSYTANFT
jgi:hypothetical protein